MKYIRFQKVMAALSSSLSANNEPSLHWNKPMMQNREMATVMNELKRLCGSTGYVDGVTIISLDDDHPKA